MAQNRTCRRGTQLRTLTRWGREREAVLGRVASRFALRISVSDRRRARPGGRRPARRRDPHPHLEQPAPWRARASFRVHLHPEPPHSPCHYRHECRTARRGAGARRVDIAAAAVRRGALLRGEREAGVDEADIAGACLIVGGLVIALANGALAAFLADGFFAQFDFWNAAGLVLPAGFHLSTSFVFGVPFSPPCSAASHSSWNQSAIAVNNNRKAGGAKSNPVLLIKLHPIVKVK